MSPAALPAWGVSMDLAGSTTAIVLGFPAILMIGMLAMNRVERKMADQPPRRPELRLVHGEGPELSADSDDVADRPPLRLVVGATLPDDLL